MWSEAWVGGEGGRFSLHASRVASLSGRYAVYGLYGSVVEYFKPGTSGRHDNESENASTKHARTRVTRPLIFIK